MDVAKLNELEAALIAKKACSLREIGKIDEMLRLLAMKKLHPDDCSGDRFKCVWHDIGSSYFDNGRFELLLFCGVAQHCFEIRDVPEILCGEEQSRIKRRIKHARERFRRRVPA